MAISAAMTLICSIVLWSLLPSLRLHPVLRAARSLVQGYSRLDLFGWRGDHQRCILHRTSTLSSWSFPGHAQYRHYMPRR